MYHQNDRNTVSSSPVKYYLKIFSHTHNMEDSFKPLYPGSRPIRANMHSFQLGLPPNRAPPSVHCSGCHGNPDTWTISFISTHSKNIIPSFNIGCGVGAPPTGPNSLSSPNIQIKIFYTGPRMTPFTCWMHCCD